MKNRPKFSEGFVKYIGITSGIFVIFFFFIANVDFSIRLESFIQCMILFVGLPLFIYLIKYYYPEIKEQNENFNLDKAKLITAIIFIPTIIFAFVGLASFSLDSDDECGMCRGIGYYGKIKCPACDGTGSSSYDPYEEYQELFD